MYLCDKPRFYLTRCSEQFKVSPKTSRFAQSSLHVLVGPSRNRNSRGCLEPAHATIMHDQRSVIPSRRKLFAWVFEDGSSLEHLFSCVFSWLRTLEGSCVIPASLVRVAETAKPISTSVTFARNRPNCTTTAGTQGTNVRTHFLAASTLNRSN
jgi:hypothetical protein